MASVATEVTISTYHDEDSEEIKTRVPGEAMTSVTNKTEIKRENANSYKKLAAALRKDGKKVAAASLWCGTRR